MDKITSWFCGEVNSTKQNKKIGMKGEICNKNALWEKEVSNQSAGKRNLRELEDL